MKTNSVGIFSGIIYAALVLALNVVGDVLNSALNPKTRSANIDKAV